MPADADHEEPPDTRTGRRPRTRLVVCAVVVAVAFGAWLWRDRIFGSDQHADQVNAARQIEAPAGPLDHRIGPAQPSTSTPIRTLPGASVMSISARLPAGLRPDFSGGGHMYAGDIPDQKIRATVRIIMGVVTPGRQDQVTDMLCIFRRDGIAADAAVLGEVKGCLGAILPDPDQATASAWLDTNAAKLRPHEEQHTEIGPATVRISRMPDNITVAVLVLQPGPSPSGGR